MLKEIKEGDVVDEDKMEHFFTSEIEKYQKDKERHKKIKEIYENFEIQREKLLQTLALKEEKFQETKLIQQKKMVF